MESVTREDYVYLKGILLNNSSLYTDNNKLQKLKHMYEPEIHSRRKIDRIHSVQDLVLLLEKLACVSEKNIKILGEIAAVIACREYLAEMYNRHNIASCATPHVSYQPSVPVSNSVIVENSNHDVVNKVQELILSEIGIKWAVFARALNVKESKIDQLKMKYSNQTEACVKDVLAFHMENVHPREWKLTLVEALTKARRNDLRRQVEKLFATFDCHSIVFKCLQK